MSDKLSFEDRVVIVTGAGAGLGRTHALEFASRGAKIIVNDLGGSTSGDGGGDTSVAQSVVNDIKALGGEAVANTDSVEDGAKISSALWTLAVNSEPLIMLAYCAIVPLQAHG